MSGSDRDPPPAHQVREGAAPSPQSDAELARIRTVLAAAVAKVCPRRLSHLREDLVQAAMIRVIESQRRTEQPGIRTASYLWKVAYTAMVDEMRRVDRRKEVSMEDRGSDGPSGEVLAGSTGGESLQHLGIEIRDCISRLIEPRRASVVLHLYGFQAEEAARSLGWNLKRVRNLTYRGLADLRRCLESKGLKP
jgi:RNA polymerase sigma-70 factor (ECF subfamily)